MAMNTTTSNPLHAALAIREGLLALRTWSRAVAGWLEAQRRAHADSVALAELSDRDLHDIGLDRGFVSAVAKGRWTRDMPDL